MDNELEFDGEVLRDVFLSIANALATGVLYTWMLGYIAFVGVVLYVAYRNWREKH